ncbi:MAG: diacylglycerol kinase, partial [Lactococcus garvieae]
VDDVNIEYLKSSQIKVEPLTDKKMMINVDGEYGGDAPVTFRNLHGHIEIFVNLDEINNDHYLGDEEEELEAVAQKFTEEAEQLKEEVK